MRKALLGTVLLWLAGAAELLAEGTFIDPDNPLPPPELRVLPFQSWCGYPHTFWLNSEFQATWMKNGQVPPLVTGGPAASLGILGQPGTVLLYGNEDVNHGTFLGGKFMGGVWGDYDQLYGLEGGFHFAAEKEDMFVATTPNGPGAPIIARPVIDATTGAPSSSLALIPGFTVGSIDVLTSTSLLGAEGGLVFNCRCFRDGRIDAVVGFRYLELDEELFVDEAGEIGAANPLLAGFRAVISDELTARSRFYGPSLAIKVQYCRDGWFFHGLGRLALGVTQEEIGAVGITAFGPPTGSLLFVPGGFLALQTNTGVRQEDRFGVVPEVGVRVGYQVLERLKAYVSVSFLYWNRVIRVGETVDVQINPTQLPSAFDTLRGPAAPVDLFNESTFWAATLGFGLEVRY